VNTSTISLYSHVNTSPLKDLMPGAPGGSIVLEGLAHPVKLRVQPGPHFSGSEKLSALGLVPLSIGTRPAKISSGQSTPHLDLFFLEKSFLSTVSRSSKDVSGGAV
jgi:hypothetical protein